VTDQPFRTAHLSQIETVPLAGDGGLGWKPVREALGIEAFGINVWTAGEPGAEVIGPHVETDDQAGSHEELYLVLAGRATFTVGDDEVDAPPGTMVAVLDPTARRMAVAREADTAVLVVGGRVGAGFEVAAWEFIVRASALYRRGDAAGAAAELRRGLPRHPDCWPLLYDLACYESLSGDHEAALAHLAKAGTLSPRARELARAEPDFEPIRGARDFERAVG
jgi:hypothetical protein